MKLKYLSGDLCFWTRNCLRPNCGFFFLITFCASLLACCANGNVLYVDENGGNPVPPYADWGTAATSIQDAIDASSAGDLILVTNGIYQSGGRPADGGILVNRVLLDKAITVQSVNGPAVTTIEGYQDSATTNADDAVRGAYLVDGATLIGFTIEHGATRQLWNTPTNADANGGGVWCQSSNALVSNCIIVSNACSIYGAGVYSGKLTGCQVNYNSIQGFGSYGAGAVAYSSVADSTINSNFFFESGGEAAGAGAFSCDLSNCVIDGNNKSGVMECTLDHCMIANNTNSLGGAGAVVSTLNDCVVSGNQTPGMAGGASACVLNNCVISNNWAGNRGGGVVDAAGPIGTNNVVIGNSSGWSGGGLYVTTTSNLVVDDWHFVNNSATRDGGGLYFNPATTSIGITLTNCTFEGNVSGGNGGGFCPYWPNTVIGISNCTFNGNVATGNGGGAYYAALVNCLVTGNQAANGGGVYGVVTNCVVNSNIAAANGGGVFSVAPGEPEPFIPNSQFTNNYAANGGGAYGGVFTNCVFAENSAETNGGAVAYAALSHCLVISNQADFGGGGFIDGNSFPSYPGAQETYVACEFVGNSAAQKGGGIYGPASGFIAATNCILLGNSALNDGGALFQASLAGGTICSNSAVNGGGAYNASVSKCSIFANVASGNGGGTYGNGGFPGIQYCVLSNNVAGTNGGGACNARVINCVETGNSAAYGGASYSGSVANSTIAANTATIAGGGTYGGTLVDDIIYDNTAPTGPNYSGSGGYTACCTTPLPPANASSSCISEDPVFVNPAAGNFRLQSNSPCINMGNTAAMTTDLDGRPRVVGGRIDIGAYEFQGPGIGEFTAWLQQHGLPTDGSADYTDSDGDGMNNWQEWIAGTDPLASTSVLKLMAPALLNDGADITWQSVTGRTYFVQRSADISEPFLTLTSNVLGQAGTTSFIDTTATNGASYFYRIGIQ